ncbi:MAG TPA: type II CRISPR-associated endonuclease Cas1 [Tenuifilaceae bacterium]|nr:type II CRISPR-associated endonuclease Cas1 [Tenuifilaceae bacterium]
MIKRTLYFGNPAYLSMKDSQLVVDKPDADKVTIPIEDIGVVLLDNPQVTVTHPLLNALLNNNTAVVTCNEKHMPSGVLLPLEGNTLQSERYADQINASLPLKKQLWQQTVQAKIANQAALLQELGVDIEPMQYFQRSVRSGDPDNYEGRAAAFYWKCLFDGVVDGEFVRGRFEDDPNNLLNYGYAVLRAIVARSLVGSGLLPTLGIHHRNKYNAFCLADDLMEPYRPFVDRLVLSILKDCSDVSELTTEVKSKLLVIPAIDVTIDGKSSPLMIATQRTTASLNDCFEGCSRKLLYPVL